jgi:hypothetical protein
MRPLLAGFASCLLVTAWPGATLAPPPAQTRQSIDIRGHQQSVIVYGGPRGSPKRLWIVPAADHRFSNNLPEFDRCLIDAIAWVNANRPR